MRPFLAILSVFLIAGTAPAKNKTAGAGTPPDTALLSPHPTAKTVYTHGKRLSPGHGMKFRGEKFKGEKRTSGRDKSWFTDKKNRYRGRPYYKHLPHYYKHLPPPHIMFAPFLFLLVLAIGIVNILLTIIVSLDMARSGRFNGLWVPVLLIAGIPGSAIYALFRIGDRVQPKSAA